MTRRIGFVPLLDEDAPDHEADRADYIDSLMQTVRTDYVYPPIPIRDFDWQAITDNYEPGCPIGYGQTEDEAIADLQEQLKDRS